MNDDELEGDLMDTALEEFEDYEKYLDAHMSDEDLFYLEDKELARQLIEVGYHGKGEILTREQFIKRKAAIAEAKKINTSPCIGTNLKFGLSSTSQIFRLNRGQLVNKEWTGFSAQKGYLKLPIDESGLTGSIKLR